MLIGGGEMQRQDSPPGKFSAVDTILVACSGAILRRLIRRCVMVAAGNALFKPEDRFSMVQNRASKIG